VLPVPHISFTSKAGNNDNPDVSGGAKKPSTIFLFQNFEWENALLTLGFPVFPGFTPLKKQKTITRWLILQ